MNLKKKTPTQIWCTGYLLHLTTWILGNVSPNSTTGGEIQLLGAITKPFVDLIVQLDKKVLECWASIACNSSDDASLMKEFCEDKSLQLRTLDLRPAIAEASILATSTVSENDGLVECELPLLTQIFT